MKNGIINSIVEMDVIEDVYFYNLKSSKSPLLYHFYEKTDLWKLLYRSIKDELVLHMMILNLDLNIAPVHTFITRYKKELEKRSLSKFDKQCIGYHVSYLLAALGYKKTRQIYRKDAIIKYAAYYELESSEMHKE